MTAYCYYTVEPPTKWQAGTTGASETPFYFDCADCGQEDAEIAGVIAPADLDHAPRFTDLAVIPVDGGPMVRAAMFCSACYAERLAQQAAKMEAMQA